MCLNFALISSCNNAPRRGRERHPLASDGFPHWFFLLLLLWVQFQLLTWLTGARMLCACFPSVLHPLLRAPSFLLDDGGSPGPHRPPLTSHKEQGEVQGGDTDYQLEGWRAFGLLGWGRVSDSSPASGKSGVYLGRLASVVGV